MKKWKCTVCGYIHTGDSPPDKCPVCAADRSLFIELEAETPKEKVAPPSFKEKNGRSERWKCGVCGYPHNADAPPGKCPVCNADEVHFKPVTPELKTITTGADNKSLRGYDEPEPAKTNGTERNLSSGLTKYYDWVAGKLTVLHAHPISVHIPNGVLPVSILFILASTFFNSHTLAVAAYCNMVIVTLSMPAVLFTGYNDWQRRYGGHVTQVFLTKIICGGIVSALALILSLWWTFDREILAYAGTGRNLFILLCLVMVAAAALAGYMGGKLVFPQNDE